VTGLATSVVDACMITMGPVMAIFAPSKLMQLDEMARVRACQFIDKDSSERSRISLLISRSRSSSIWSACRRSTLPTFSIERTSISTERTSRLASQAFDKVHDQLLERLKHQLLLQIVLDCCC
jgi:hypothetical protein